ncbi:T9SS type A sorting domain-containing protein [Hymenobacter gummosus]|uniref:T9SS type A sorting domain-containing protein n=1 Tax=Hymenobacter gummosus TaxID=1776032 RepID=A0A431U8N5_9BACT|nr:T9SS type A sorting domain-containing protein [Hymenobacter gummosus]RTQ53407.1 T9SS type A sorting domain-containing protein [Hymenobacter gummosus]
MRLISTPGPWLLILLATAPLATSAQVLSHSSGTLFVSNGGLLHVIGSAQQTGTATLRTSGTATITGNLTAASSTTTDLSTGILDVAGNVDLQGSIGGSTGTLRLSGTGAQNLSLNAGTVPNLTLGKPSGTATLTQALNVRQVLTMAGTGNLTTNGQALTLLSDATGTALLANTGTGQVSGNVTVQRYIDPTLNAGLGYRHLAAPAQSQTVASFGSGGQALVVNPAYNTSATPNLTTPFPTIYRYDQARLASSPATTLSAFDKGWLSPASLTDAAQLAFQGYTVQLPGGSTLSFTGQLAQTPGTIPLARNSGATAADAGWNFIGNPYASPLDLSTITASQRTNMDAAFYVYESTSQYAGQYRSYVNGFGNTLIGSSQAFFVRVSSGQTSGSLLLNNANRVTSYAQQAPVRRDQRPQLQLQLTGQGVADELIVYAQAGATDAADADFDALKLANPHGLNLAAVAATGQELAIDGRAAFTNGQVLPLAVRVPQAGSYTFTAATVANLPAGLDATLVDLTTGTRTLLTNGAAYAATLAAGTAPGRFRLELGSRVTATTSGMLAQQVSLYPNPTSSHVALLRPAAWGPATMQVLNSVGQVVLQRPLPAAETQLDVRSLPVGVYQVRLTTPAGTINKRLVRQ